MEISAIDLGNLRLGCKKIVFLNSNTINFVDYFDTKDQEDLPIRSKDL